MKDDGSMIVKVLVIQHVKLCFTFFSNPTCHSTPCSTGMPQGQEAVKAEDDQKLTPLSMASKQGSGRMAAVLAAAGFQARKHGIIVGERCMDA